MYTFIIPTNRESACIDELISTLSSNIDKDDDIIVINYGSNHLKYRDYDIPIEYQFSNNSKYTSINRYLPSLKNRNVVVFEDDISIDKTSIDKIKQLSNDKVNFLRVDAKSAKTGIISKDFRIGSGVTANNTTELNVVFHTDLIHSVGIDIKSFILQLNLAKIGINFLSNIKITKVGVDNQSVYDCTIIIPSYSYKYINQIKAFYDVKEIKVLDFDPVIFSKYINIMIPKAKGSHIILINPLSKIFNDDMMKKIVDDTDGKTVIVYNNDETEGLTDDSWIVFPKNMYITTKEIFNNIKDFQSYLVNHCEGKIKYIKSTNSVSTVMKNQEVEKQQPRYGNNNIISIIIPFMYNGDRYPLFEASIESLNKYRERYDNIEIIVHETAPERYITDNFISKYDIKYMFSEWNDLFHRAWALNVPVRKLSTGDTLVFFDADIIVTDMWMKELISCDKNRCYIGWGKMTNLDKQSTAHYIRTKTIMTNKYDRVRIPDGHGAIGGINIIPRRIFYNIGGWPESYNGFGYGGEDNSMAFKMSILGVYNGKV